LNKCVRNNCRKYFKKANYKEEVTKSGNHAQFCSYGKQSGHKVDSLRSSDKICFTVYGNEMVKEESWASFLQSVVIFGRCHLVESGEKTTKLLKQFAMKYYPNEQMVDEEIAQAGKAAQLFEIEIEHMSGKEVQER
jgi:nitroimidazol reductase NimA-like FMN-containing flavoprotein (pyridoxamine 5'-phosphate oxidase superfamily)